ncbi:MAG: peptidoglycan glycosyltransferase [Flavobacteriia bacterium]|nr:peptidoglycan glycosyltransferase [Flavobacteriia bacterium]
MNLENRKYLLIGLVFITAILFAIRLTNMQLFDPSWKRRAAEIAEKRREIIPPRGVFYDRNMKKIVVNHISYNLMVVEKKLIHFDTLAFAKLIGWSSLDVKNRLQEIKDNEGFYLNPATGKKESNFRSDRPYPFLKDLTLDEITKLAPHLGDFNGAFYEEPVATRFYPFANAANIFGYMSEVTREEIEEDPFYRAGMNIGRSGIERSYEEVLRGKKGVRFVVTDATAHEVKPYANKQYDTLAQPSKYLKLGLDIDLQIYGESLMQHKQGCIVAIEPESGEILTMVSSPSYDPNLLSGRKNIRKNYPALLLDPRLPLFARPLQAEYPPGSIFKLLQSLICLQEGKITANTGFSCNKSVVGCHNHPTASSVVRAIQYSCNPYFYAAVRRVIQPNVALKKEEDARIGLDRWYEYMTLFGLGKKIPSDIGLSGQRSGLIPNSTYYDRYLGKGNWAFSTICSIAIGQGEIKMTPLQMAHIAALIANRGWYITPHFVKSIGLDGPKKEYTEKHVVPVEKQHFETVIEGMRRVVHEPGGTGSKARNNQFIVCGKTGTVQNGKNKKNHSVFIAFAPKDNPKIALAVFVENAGAGGEWAAPIAGLMMEKYLLKTVNDKEKEEFIKNARLSTPKK